MKNSNSSSSAFPALSLGFTILGEIFAYVSFCCCFFQSKNRGSHILTGWYLLGVFLFLAFTGLGHKCQDHLSLWGGVHVCLDETSVYTLIQKSFFGGGGKDSEPMLTPREKSSLQEAQMMVEPSTLHYAGQRAQHTTD